MYLIGVILSVLASGALGMFLDFNNIVDFRGTYWVIGLFGGFFAGVCTVFFIGRG